MSDFKIDDIVTDKLGNILQIAGFDTFKTFDYYGQPSVASASDLRPATQAEREKYCRIRDKALQDEIERLTAVRASLKP